MDDHPLPFYLSLDAGAPPYADALGADLIPPSSERGKDKDRSRDVCIGVWMSISGDTIVVPSLSSH